MNRNVNENPKEYDVIMGCDTVIVLDGEIIGKPRDNDDAKRTLKRSGIASSLSSRTHEVFTGVALIDANSCELFHERTSVKFGTIPDDVIEQYVRSGEPLGRAGSYGIQAAGAMFVESIDGCFYNVVGLPAHQVAKRLWLRATKPH
uniref:Maf-like protein n=1 Tax=Parascaris equorum TaxID=6256 RepID=A0A914RQW1_PAREQ